MVKTKSPMLSLGASGTIADTLTSQSWKGRTYMRKTPKPSDPKSGKQVAMRSMFQFLTQSWAGIPADEKETWNEQAARAEVLPFNAYLNQNLMRWATGRYPQQEFEQPPVGGFAGGPGPAAVPQGRGLRIGRDILTETLNWGTIIHAIAAAPDQPTFDGVVHVHQLTSTGFWSFFLTPLESGTHWFKTVHFSVSGVKGITSGPFMGTVP